MFESFKFRKKLKESSKDLVALGSFPFFIIVLVRIYIGDFWLIFQQLLLAFILIYGLYLIFKYEIHVASLIPIIFFVSLFYNQTIFTIFAFTILFLGIISGFYLYPKKKVILGILAGILISFISYKIPFIF